MQHDDDELTYWRHRTPVGVKVEEIKNMPHCRSSIVL